MGKVFPLNPGLFPNYYSLLRYSAQTFFLQPVLEGKIAKTMLEEKDEVQEISHYKVFIVRTKDLGVLPWVRTQIFHLVSY